MAHYELYQRKPGKEYFLPLSKSEVDLSDYHVTHEGEVNGNSINEMLEQVFVTFNRDDRPTAQTTYSMSMNDLVCIDGTFYLCAMLGWEKLDYIKQ